MMDATPRKPYPSDLSDEQWAILEPLLPAPVKAGPPRKTDLREVVDAIFYVLSTGCAWSALPHEFPPEATVRDSSISGAARAVAAGPRHAAPPGPGGGREGPRAEPLAASTARPSR